jgi:hypothetical protein
MGLVMFTFMASSFLPTYDAMTSAKSVTVNIAESPLGWLFARGFVGLVLTAAAMVGRRLGFALGSRGVPSVAIAIAVAVA